MSTHGGVLMWGMGVLYHSPKQNIEAKVLSFDPNFKFKF